jgi:hypothetical protein
MTEHGLALRLGVALEDARQLLRAHRRAYPAFWAWSDGAAASGQLTGRMRSVFGWPLHVRAGDNPRSLRSFPMQANGAEMLRLACIAATEAESRCAPRAMTPLLIRPRNRDRRDRCPSSEFMGRAERAGAGRWPAVSDRRQGDPVG